MDGTTEKLDGKTGSYFWMRHATEVKVGERTHTIEMSVPVPIGASAEMREQLFREAEAGMDQLARYIESRGDQKSQRNQPAQPQSMTPSPKPQSPAAAPAQKSVAPAPSLSSASLPPASTSGPTPVRETAQAQVTSPSAESKDVVVPPTRPHIGATLPNTSGLAGDASASVKLQQFIRIIKEKYGLNPRQAMDLLKVRSLDGLNLSEALRQLQQILGKTATNTTSTTPPVSETKTSPTEPEVKTPTSSPVALITAPSSPATPEPGSKLGPGPASPPSIPSTPPAPRPPQVSVIAPSNAKSPDIKEIQHAVVRENPSAYGFEEEVDLDDSYEDVDFLNDLTGPERAIAERVLDKLREERGSNPASPSRLKVLDNVVGSQLSNEQLLQLIQGVWGVATVKKLKNDQVEALISWGKEDDFAAEADLVLSLLQEGEYASSDR